MRWRLLLGIAIAAVAAASVPTVSAASSEKKHSDRPAAYVPLLDSPAAVARTAPAGVIPADLIFNNMDYNGGPVMPSNTDYMLLWSPGGREAYPDGYIAGVETWFEDLAHDSGGSQNTDSVSAQYQDLTGAFARYATKFGGVLVDTQPYPAGECPAASPVIACLTDAQIQVELDRFVGARRLARDLSHEYFLMTPPHVETCFSNDPTMSFGGCSAGEPRNIAGFCAYHGNTAIEPFLIYSNDPYVPGNRLCDDGNHPNGFWDGELSGGLSHEQNESVTDPIPNDAWTNGAGPDQGLEVGDQCVRRFGTTLGTHNGAKFNQVINGHFYWYQEEWSNVGHTCLQRLAPVGTMPTATFTVTTGGDALTLNFDATGSTAPGGVAQYVWQFNDAFGAQTVEQTTPTISHSFPSAGAYSIGLTVFAHDGLSTGTGGMAVTGSNGLSSGFTAAVSNKEPHKTVTFSALFATMSAQPVLVNFWDFGDGSVGAGANPTHRYTKPGSYVVTLVQFSGVGSAFPGAGAGPIVTQTITVGNRPQH